MDVRELAQTFTDLLKAGDFRGAEAYWSDDVAMHEPPHSGFGGAEGREACAARNEEFMRENEVHFFEAKGPYVHGDQFAVFMALDVTRKATGERITMDEVALYTVRDGRIVEERFFY